MGPEVTKSAVDALTLRYSLLPFLYTLFVKAHLTGAPVVTPTFFNMNTFDAFAMEVDTQFFWGSELLIVPVLEQVILKIN